jgi:Ras family protein T1
MTRVKLPPDPQTGCITTIVDSQKADFALEAAADTMESSSVDASSIILPGVDSVDSIVLVYDLDRVDTFDRLEKRWLPLLERCYGRKVRARLLHCVYLRTNWNNATFTYCLYYFSF